MKTISQESVCRHRLVEYILGHLYFKVCTFHHYCCAAPGEVDCGIPSCPKSTVVTYLTKWTDQVLFLKTWRVGGRKLMFHKRMNEPRSGRHLTTLKRRACRSRDKKKG